MIVGWSSQIFQHRVLIYMYYEGFLGEFYLANLPLLLWVTFVVPITKLSLQGSTSLYNECCPRMSLLGWDSSCDTMMLAWLTWILMVGNHSLCCEHPKLKGCKPCLLYVGSGYIWLQDNCMLERKRRFQAENFILFSNSWVGGFNPSPQKSQSIKHIIF